MTVETFKMTVRTFKMTLTRLKKPVFAASLLGETGGEFLFKFFGATSVAL
jgi:hypothetical protein